MAVKHILTDVRRSAVCASRLFASPLGPEIPRSAAVTDTAVILGNISLVRRREPRTRRREAAWRLQSMREVVCQRSPSYAGLMLKQHEIRQGMICSVLGEIRSIVSGTHEREAMT